MERLWGKNKMVKEFDLNKSIKEWEKLEYNMFKRWFEERPLRNPQIAITSSLARMMAYLVYERNKESVKRLKEELKKDSIKYNYKEVINRELVVAWIDKIFGEN